MKRAAIAPLPHPASASSNSSSSGGSGGGDSSSSSSGPPPSAAPSTNFAIAWVHQPHGTDVLLAELLGSQELFALESTHRSNSYFPAMIHRLKIVSGTYYNCSSNRLVAWLFPTGNENAQPRRLLRLKHLSYYSYSSSVNLSPLKKQKQRHVVVIFLAATSIDLQFKTRCAAARPPCLLGLCLAGDQDHG